MAGVLVFTAAVGAAIACAVRVVGHAADDVYGIPGWGVALTLGLVALSFAGDALVAWSQEPAAGAVALVAGALGGLGLLTFLPLGLLGLAAAALLAVRTLGRRGAGARTVAGGLLAGAPLPLLAILALGGPVVRCHPDGSSAGESFFMGVASGRGVGASSGASGAAAPGTETGHAESDGYAYSYTCRDGRLVRFRLRWR